MGNEPGAPNIPNVNQQMPPSAPKPKPTETFAQQFAREHNRQGAGGHFERNGKIYSTNRADGRDLRAERMMQQHKPSVPKAPEIQATHQVQAQAKPNETFAQQFAREHRRQGPGGYFERNGKIYSTNRADGKDLSKQNSSKSSIGLHGANEVATAAKYGYDINVKDQSYYFSEAAYHGYYTGKSKTDSTTRISRYLDSVSVRYDKISAADKDFYAVKAEKNTIYISARGTIPTLPGDYINNDAILTGNEPPRYKQFKKFANKIINKYGKNHTFILTGHSFGAFISAKYARDNNLPAYVFSTPGNAKYTVDRLKNSVSLNKEAEKAPSNKIFQFMVEDGQIADFGKPFGANVIKQDSNQGNSFLQKHALANYHPHGAHGAKKDAQFLNQTIKGGAINEMGPMNTQLNALSYVNPNSNYYGTHVNASSHSAHHNVNSDYYKTQAHANASSGSDHSAHHNVNSNYNYYGRNTGNKNKNGKNTIRGGPVYD